MADIRTEYVHDGVTSIEKDPVAQRGSLDFRRRKTCIATGSYDPIGDGAHMHARTAGGDDHSIGERRLALKLDRDDVFRLCVLKSFNNDLRQGVGRQQIAGGGAAGVTRRSKGRQECQRRIPLRAGADSRSRIAKDATSVCAFQAPRSLGRSSRQHDLSDMLRALDPLMRFGNLGKGEYRVDNRLAASGFQ